MRRPLKPAVAASVMSAAIASGVVGIGNHLIIDSADEGSVALYAQANPPLAELAGIGLKRRGKHSVRCVTRKSEKQMPNVLRRNAMLEQRIVDRIRKRIGELTVNVTVAQRPQGPREPRD